MIKAMIKSMLEEAKDTARGEVTLYGYLYEILNPRGKLYRQPDVFDPSADVDWDMLKPYLDSSMSLPPEVRQRL